MNYSIPLARTIRLALSAATAILETTSSHSPRRRRHDSPTALVRPLARHRRDRARSRPVRGARDCVSRIRAPGLSRRDECLLAEWLRSQVPSLAELSTEAIEDRIWAAVVRMEPLPRVDQVLASLAADRVPIGAVSNAAFSAARSTPSSSGMGSRRNCNLCCRAPIFACANPRLVSTRRRSRDSALVRQRRGSSATRSTRTSSVRPRSACSRFGSRRAVR